MVHGAISGVAKGPLTIFEPNEKVTSEVCSHRVLPRIHQYITAMERQNLGWKRGVLMEDKALVHTSKFTRSWHAY